MVFRVEPSAGEGFALKSLVQVLCILDCLRWQKAQVKDTKRGLKNSNNRNNNYDIRITIKDKEGNVVDPMLVKAGLGRIKGGGTRKRQSGLGVVRIKIKGKQYRQLSKALRNIMLITVYTKGLKEENTQVVLNKKKTKVKRVYLTDDDGYKHALKNKDYTAVVNADGTVTVNGKRNTYTNSEGVTLTPVDRVSVK